MNKDPFSLEGKNIIITGASSGIGRECAIACSQRGANIILAGRDQGRLNATLSMTENAGNHIVLAFDLTDYISVDNVINEKTARFGRIDGLINCAGISTTLPFNMVKPEKMNEFFRTNVEAAINLTRIIVKPSIFSEHGGSVIFISSVMGSAGENGKVLYSMTKGALDAAARSLAIELASRKIRVNTVSPGVVETPMSKSAVYNRNVEAFEKVKAMHPLGTGNPNDVANACVYLLSDAAQWVTGINLVVDGGYLAR